MGPMANVLQSSVRISSWLSQIVVSHVRLTSTPQFSFFSVRTITCKMTDSAVSELQSDIQKVLGLLCALLYWSAFSRTATKGNLTDQDIVRTILESNSHAHSSQDEGIFLQSKWHKWYYWRKLHTVNNTNCQPTAHHKFTWGGGPNKLQEKGTPRH